MDQVHGRVHTVTQVYDFLALSAYDFELLVADLASLELGRPVEIFSPGPDEGIDLRYLSDGGGSLIVQVKHWRQSGFAKLLNHLANDELPKVQRLSPDRYVLVTSVALTPKRKAKLVGALSGHIKRPADVVGPAELNMLLRKYPQVERAHFKLWLSSTRVLQQVLHSDIHTSTNYALKDIERRVALYVHTPAFAEAVSILNEHHACVIAGIPGIGKSMLAEMLLYALVGEGYEPIVLRNELSDADRIYETDRRQVFLYDDFLGQTASVESSERTRMPTLQRSSVA